MTDERASRTAGARDGAARRGTGRRDPRFAGALAAVLLGLGLALTAVGAAVYAQAGPAERAVLAGVLRAQAAFLVVAAVLVALLIGLLLAAAARAYVDRPRRLAADVRVMAGANPAHRADGAGPPALRALAEAVNALAERHESARRDVDERVAAAAAELERERHRLAALMGELTVAVLVCAEDGRILLYNAGARELLGGAGGVGLGRSVFGVLDRGLVAHGLERVDAGAGPHESTTERGGVLVRVRLARVPAGGFVLVCEDATATERAAARHAELVRATGELVRGAAGSIGAAAGNVLDYPEMTAPQLRRFVEVIAAESARLGEAAGRLLARPAADDGARWAVADIAGRDLLAAAVATVRRTGGRAGDVATHVEEPAEECWFAVDSFTVAGALAEVVRVLADRHGVERVALAARPEGDLGRIDLCWDGAPVPAGALERWAPEPGAQVRRHGGELWADARDPVVRLLLPRSRGGSRRRLATREDAPPALYDFELARFQPGPSEWDDSPLHRLPYTVFDTETTGFHPDAGDEIVSIGAVRIVGGRLLRAETFERLVDPRRHIPRTASAVHGITADLVRDAPPLDEVLPAFAEFARDSVLVGHNVAFDMAFLAAAGRRTGVRLDAPLLDTLLIDGVVHPDHERHSLEVMADRLGVSLVGRHTALGDALLTGEVFLRLLPLLGAHGVRTLGELRAAAARTAQARTSERLYREVSE